jgi:hypothetical protein
MKLNRKGDAQGYVRVEVRSRSPKLWGWSLFEEDNPRAVEHSEQLFSHAEDAWKAGHAVLNQFKPVRRRAA